MEQDWDLHAVVRGCATTSTSTTATFTNLLSPSIFSPPKQDEHHFFCFPDPFETTENFEDLHNLYKPFFPKPQQQPLSFKSLPVFNDFKSQTQLKHSRSSASASASTSSQSPSRIKRRKNQQKRVCQVPAEGLSSDVWAWRKYGQKPIKGSPYPRGYYRCSSSKGCLARKQVERNRSDPTMFIVTYTAEHNHPVPTHRNSLAGSTRQKTQTTTAGAGDTSLIGKPLSPTSSPAGVLSPTTSFLEDDKSIVFFDEEMMEDDEVGASPETDLTDDFFAGLDDFVGATSGECSSDQFPATISMPWLGKNAATAAGGG